MPTGALAMGMGVEENPTSFFYLIMASTFSQFKGSRETVVHAALGFVGCSRLFSKSLLVVDFFHLHAKPAWKVLSLSRHGGGGQRPPEAHKHRAPSLGAKLGLGPQQLVQPLQRLSL